MAKEQFDVALGPGGQFFNLFHDEFEGKPTVTVEQMDQNGNVISSAGFDQEKDARDHVQKRGGFFAQVVQQAAAAIPAEPAKPEPKPSEAVNTGSGDTTIHTPVPGSTEPVPGSTEPVTMPSADTAKQV